MHPDKRKFANCPSLAPPMAIQPVTVTTNTPLHVDIPVLPHRGTYFSNRLILGRSLQKGKKKLLSQRNFLHQYGSKKLLDHNIYLPRGRDIQYIVEVGIAPAIYMYPYYSA